MSILDDYRMWDEAGERLKRKNDPNKIEPVLADVPRWKMEEKDKLAVESLFLVNERTHKDITDGEMRWLLERCFLPGPFLWTWDFGGSPYYRLNHGHGQYDDGTGGQGPGWWANRFNDPGAPNGGQVMGKFFRTPWEALADVLPKE